MSTNIYNLLNDSITSQDSDNSSNNTNDINNWTVVLKKKENKKNIKKNLNENYVNIDNVLNNNYKQNNQKKILCKNIIYNNSCKYKDKCLYAHSLAEQKLEKIRDKAYKLIKGEISGENINIFLEKDLYRTLLTLCDLCDKCNNNKCTGGYNCKHGACSKKFIICGIDLYNGKCDGKCNKIHLSKNGLQPYFTHILESQQKYKKNTIKRA